MLTEIRTTFSTSRPQGSPGVTTITTLGLALVVAILGWTLPASAQVDFSWEPVSPAISETVTFTIADSSITPLSWDFGGSDCEGNATVIDCTWIPEYCRHIPWSYAEAGSKTVHLVTDQGEVTHTVEVQNSGECCTLDGPPTAAFQMSPNPAFVGQTISFSDLSHKASTDRPAKVTDISFEIDPINPLIGERVVVSITGVGSVESAEWDFGGRAAVIWFPNRHALPESSTACCTHTTTQEPERKL